MNSLGERISYYRKKAGMTQEQLAEKCSVTAQAVSKWENDLTAPDISLIAPLAKLFSITCDEFLGVQRAETAAVAPELVNLNAMLLKLKVDSAKGDKVNINFPLSIAEVVLKSGIIKTKGGESLSGIENIDLEQIVSLVKLGAVGKLMDVQSADGDVVEIWVE